MRRVALFLAAMLGLFTAAGAQTPMSGEGTPIIPTATQTDYARVVKQAVSGYIVPAYMDLNKATGELASAVGNFCADPNPAKADRLRAAFRGTVIAWAGV